MARRDLKLHNVFIQKAFFWKTNPIIAKLKTLEIADSILFKLQRYNTQF